MVFLFPPALALSPEGTRNKVKRWKTGFYHIAIKANVPILFFKIDYKNKEVGIFNKFVLTGDYKDDMMFIQNQFLGIHGMFPENYNSEII